MRILCHSREGGNPSISAYFKGGYPTKRFDINSPDWSGLDSYRLKNGVTKQLGYDISTVF